MPLTNNELLFLSNTNRSTKKLRDMTGMTRQEFADYLGIPKGTIRNWEQGNRQPADYILVLIEKVLKYEGKID